MNALNLDSGVLRELFTGALSILIVGGTIYSSVYGHPNAFGEGLSGAIAAFYFTRQAVHTGANVTNGKP